MKDTDLTLKRITDENIELLKTNERLFGRFIKKNDGFIHNIIKKFNLDNEFDYQDFYSIGLESMLKAIKKYNPEKKVTLSTFAFRVLINDMLQEINKKNKKSSKEISMEVFLKKSENSETSEYTEVFFKKTTVDFEDDIVTKLMVNDFVNSLETLHQKIFTCRVEKKMKHDDIAKELNLNKHTYKYIWHYHVSPKIKNFSAQMR